MTEKIALHGEKPLLIEARKLLIEAGFKDDKEWNDRVCRRETTNHLCFYGDKFKLSNHEGVGTTTIIDLTTENLTTVIELLKTKLCNTTNSSNPTGSTSTQ